MRRRLLIFALLCLMLTAIPGAGSAAPTTLPELSYKFYPLRDTVFVEFYNPFFTPVDTIIVNMTIREGTGQNRVVAIGQSRMPANLVLLPGEATSARVAIRARVLRDIPPLAQFEFRILARQLEADAPVPPEVVVQDSDNGVGLSLNRDANNVPFVMGFIGLSNAITEPTSVRVEMAVLTFYDNNRRVVWSELMPINGTLTNFDSMLLWSKYEQASVFQVGDIAAVEAKFIIRNQGGQ